MSKQQRRQSKWKRTHFDKQMQTPASLLDTWLRRTARITRLMAKELTEERHRQKMDNLQPTAEEPLWTANQSHQIPGKNSSDGEQHTADDELRTTDGNLQTTDGNLQTTDHFVRPSSMLMVEYRAGGTELVSRGMRLLDRRSSPDEPTPSKTATFDVRK